MPAARANCENDVDVHCNDWVTAAYGCSVCGLVVYGLLPLDSPGQGSAGRRTIEAGTSLGKRGSQPPGSRPGETGAGDASLQTGVGEQAANGVREVGASGVVPTPMWVEQKKEDATRNRAKAQALGGTEGGTGNLVTPGVGNDPGGLLTGLAGSKLGRMHLRSSRGREGEKFSHLHGSRGQT
jgi:hypothetical protein